MGKSDDEKNKTKNLEEKEKEKEKEKEEEKEEEEEDKNKTTKKRKLDTIEEEDSKEKEVKKGEEKEEDVVNITISPSRSKIKTYSASTERTSTSTTTADVIEHYKLFVGQVPRQMMENELKPIFEEFGNVHEVVVIRDKQNQTHKGCAFVIYTKKEYAEKAIENLHNRRTLMPLTNPMQVKYADGEQERFENKLFIGMIPKNFTENELKGYFEGFGDIKELVILRNATGESRGCAFVKYQSRVEAMNAISQLNGVYRLPGASGNLIVKFADTGKEKAQRRMQYQVSNFSTGVGGLGGGVGVGVGAGAGAGAGIQ